MKSPESPRFLWLYPDLSGKGRKLTRNAGNRMESARGERGVRFRVNLIQKCRLSISANFSHFPKATPLLFSCVFFFVDFFHRILTEKAVWLGTALCDNSPLCLRSFLCDFPVYQCPVNVRDCSILLIPTNPYQSIPILTNPY